MNHPRQGAKTHFVEKILKSLEIDPWAPEYYSQLLELNKDKIEQGKLTEGQIYDWLTTLAPDQPAAKVHTIRGAGRYIPGEMASPRVWFEKPYQSPQLTFLPDFEIKKVLPFEMENGKVSIDNSFYSWTYEVDKMHVLAENDGLSIADFLAWFKHPHPVTNTEIFAWGPVDYKTGGKNG